MYFTKFGIILKELRDSKGLTQTELGKLLGVSKSVISKYETSMSYPPYDTLISIAQVFKVSTDYMLGLEKTKTININGLTESQINSLLTVVEEYKKLIR